MSIEEFYQNNHVDIDFDEIFYQNQCPETKDYYQPYCKDNHISDKHRLFFHWYMYGKKLGLQKKYTPNYNLNIIPDEFTLTTIDNPYICRTLEEKQRNINIILHKKYD